MSSVRQQDGFTLVEVLVTIVIGALFIFSITQLHLTQNRLSTEMISRNNADTLAYNNLRTYAYGKAPTWFQCTYSSGNPQPMTLINTNSAVEGIESPVIQSVVATAPYGCGGGTTTTGYPIKVVSTVTFGPEARKVVHATYSTY